MARARLKKSVPLFTRSIELTLLINSKTRPWPGWFFSDGLTQAGTERADGLAGLAQ
jgi:hypothetical protein